MAGLNVAQIIDRARSRGINLSNSEADNILSQAWDQSQFGADPGMVDSLLGGSSFAPQSNPVLDFLKASADKAAQQLEEYNKRASEFDKNNPFSFDQVLTEERAKATQQLDPYYSQTLSDYLQGVETKRTRSTTDQRTLLDELSADTDFYTGRAKISLDNALEKSREGYADAGLYSSGKALREQGQITEASNADVGNYLRGAEGRRNQINTTTSRTLEDLNTDSRQFQRDLGAEKSYNTENTAVQNSRLRSNQYAFERGQVLGAPPGVNPVQYDTTLYNYLG